MRPGLWHGLWKGLRRKLAAQQLLYFDFSFRFLFLIFFYALYIYMRDNIFSIVSKIPKGKVATYKQIAGMSGIHPRAVARILCSNEKLVEIPCHRIIMSDGKIGGYKGGVKRKIELLEAEGVEIRAGKVDLKRFGWRR